MNEKSCDQSNSGPQQGAPSEAGKQIKPPDTPMEEAPDEGSDKKDIPIGRPISEEEYQKLKDQAEKVTPPPRRQRTGRRLTRRRGRQRTI